MRCNEINIRDPFILPENGKYYMYGTRAAGFGVKTKGFDVYVSEDLNEWERPAEAFDSARFGMNTGVNWAPEVHKYKGSFYMFATFTKENNLRGTYILKSDKPEGPFLPHSKGAVTPYEWECLDGTFYIENGKPYMVFCHEHTQIIDGTICYMELKDDLTERAGEPVTLFSGSSPYWADKKPAGEHYITDGPFMYRTSEDILLMIWSTSVKDKYAECVVRFPDGSVSGGFEHLDPIITDDGGHGMIFRGFDGKLYLTFHSPNNSGFERVKILEIEEREKSVCFTGQ